MTSTDRQTLPISVIIPTLNNEEGLAKLLARLQGLPGMEIIVVAGGSADQTVACAGRYGARVIATPPGRGRQLQRGADAAAGEVLLFLHADTLLPSDFADHIHRILALPQTVAGAFLLKIAAPGPGYRVIEWGANLRSRLLSMPYGDQAIFVRRQTLQRAGGVPDLPILEDVALIRRLKRLGRIRIAPVTVVTSARRWQRLGLLRTTLVNQLVLLGALCGLSPQTLHLFYTRHRRGKNAGQG